MSNICAYCGKPADTVDHVIPKGLYPESIRSNSPQLLTVPACRECNESFSDDEEHFRNVITVMGEASGAVRELFHGKVHKSFVTGKSSRHYRQTVDMMKECQRPEGKRYLVYPMEDERFVRILKKIFKGLGFKHFRCPIPEERLFIDIQRYKLPDGLLDNVKWYSYEPEVFEYLYEIYKVGSNYISCWMLKFFKNKKFIGIIEMKEDMRFDRSSCIEL